MLANSGTMVPNRAALKKRILRFFDSKSFQRDQVKEVVDKLSQLGEVALFGGMIRDLCFESIRTFNSDVDIVVNTGNEKQFFDIVKRYNHTQNAYGGFRIFLDKWSLDVWTLPKTWAFQNHYNDCTGFKSLIYTTFFTWDAIVFEILSGEFHCRDDYFDYLNGRILDINLQPNPNVLGAVVRTWRFLELRQARLSKRLAIYLEEKTREHGVDIVSGYEVKSYNNPCMTKAHLRRSYARLVEYLDTDSDDLFELSHCVQASLYS